MRKVLLNAVVPKAGFIMVVAQSDFETVKAMVERGEFDETYIGHPATANLLGVPVNRGEYDPADRDVAYVVRLKRRLPAVADVEVTPDDLDVLFVYYAAYQPQN